MGNSLNKYSWSLVGAGSGLGSILLASGCTGSCGACYGCAGAALVLTATALLKKKRAIIIKGGEHGMAARID